MFTPIESALGALLIQAATTSYILLEGKVIGFSSVLYNSIFRPNIHSVSILTGLLLSSQFVKHNLPVFVSSYSPAITKTSTFYGSALSYLISGLLVGFGTSAGCGCTSGHMLAGLSRLRWRSFIATCTFFTTGVITTWITNNYKQIESYKEPNYWYDDEFVVFKENWVLLLTLVIVGQLWSYSILPRLGSLIEEERFNRLKNKNILRGVLGVSSGFLFGCGLLISGMTNPSKVTGFLSLFSPHDFDPSLAMIPLFCIIPNIIIWKKYLPNSKEENVEKVVNESNKVETTIRKKPAFESEYDLNFSNATDVKFLMGNAIFGIGWGMSGVCPGPAILTMFGEIGSLAIGKGCVYVIGFLVGSYFQKM